MARPEKYERKTDYTAPIAFGIFVLAGAAYIILSKLIFGANPFLVTSIPCFLMMGYAVLVALARRLRLRDDQSADNFYYMGFIFTLISLAISLYQYGAEGSLDSIVRNFGVAIASTITGITLRILFNQMRRDPVEVEHYSRLGLAEASNRVRRELDGVVQELQHFRRSNQQMLAEAFHEVRDEVAKSASDSMKASQALAEQMLGATKTASETVTTELRSTDLKAELDQTTKNLKRITTALGKASDQIEKSAGSFVMQLSSMAPLDDRLQPLIERLDGSIRGLSDRVETQTEVIQRIQVGMDQTAEIERNIARIIADEDLTAASARSGLMGLFKRRIAPEVIIDEKHPKSDS